MVIFRQDMPKLVDKKKKSEVGYSDIGTETPAGLRRGEDGWKMRRADRQVTDDAKIDAIISKCHCCRLGFSDEGAAYIVPLNFGYVSEGGKRIFYFHGAKEGRKLELIRKHHRAGFELDTAYRLREGESACSYSAAFCSVVGTGTVDFVAEPGEKRVALQELMRHTAGTEGWEFTDAMLDSVCVFKLEVVEIACKEHE